MTAWEKEVGRSFYDIHLKSLVKVAWDELWERYPSACEEMLKAVPEEYRLEGTGFTKVTAALNNPCPLHFDHQNFGVTFLVCIDLDGGLQGGSHVITSLDYSSAVVVSTSSEGVWILGDYRRVLHANAATRAGRRFVLTAYCSQALVDRVHGREIN